ncbi:MAG: amidohydrolase family protein [Bacteroidales bacterium]|jgi:predicted TIM-barrel fold metal-dependent hydrolase|nr:amidohydrolase family protein [Bacteroidales bacterium]
MTKDEFLRKAMAEISSDATTRVSPIIKTQLNNNPVFDIHCHIFDKDSITKNYFLLRLLDNLDSDKKLDDLLEFIINQEENNELDGLFDIMSFDNMKQILDYYLNEFAYEKNIICTPLMMDLSEAWFFEPKKSMKEQITELKTLMKSRAIMPFLAIDPRKAEKHGDDNLYNLFMQAFTGENKFYGVKVYPALGYLPSDPQLMPIYQICEAKNIPITSHCGGTTIRTNKNNITVKGLQIINNEVVSYIDTIHEKGKEKANRLNNPLLWEPVLKTYKNLKLNLGHFGGVSEWEKYPNTTKQNRISEINRLMKEYKNLYADFSFNITKDETFNNLSHALDNNEIFRERAMFGTDYWVVLSGGDFKKNQRKFITQINQYKDLLMQANPKKFLFG